ncbi:MAG TPA: phage protein Gp27 family protein [Azospirillaceae bacterium]|nr:phage protein Gp27 family protein [Azospirillaceae bacterium]
MGRTENLKPRLPPRREDPARLEAALAGIAAAGWTSAEVAGLLEAAVGWEPPTDGPRSATLTQFANRLRRLLTQEGVTPTRLLSHFYGLQPATTERMKLRHLPAEARRELDAMVAAGATADSIAARMTELGTPLSCQTVAKYRTRTAAQLERYREAQAVAGAWTEALGGAARGEVGRLLQEMLKTVAFQTLSSLGDGDGPDPKDLMVLAKAVKEVAGAEKLTTELELKLRRELAEALAPRLAEAERAAEDRPKDLKAALARIREEVYGIVEGQ